MAIRSRMAIAVGSLEAPDRRLSLAMIFAHFTQKPTRYSLGLLRDIGTGVRRRTIQIAFKTPRVAHLSDLMQCLLLAPGGDVISFANLVTFSVWLSRNVPNTKSSDCAYPQLNSHLMHLVRSFILGQSNKSPNFNG